MAKAKVKKCLNNAVDCKNKVNYLIKNKLDFTIKMSNYTTEIICPALPFFNIKYLQKPQSNISFIAYQKIKRDLLTWSANEMPIIEKSNCTYFDMSKKIHKIKDKRACKNLDLTSAYANVLFNDFFICQETFDFINKLRKKDRLVCVGMLASNKDTFIYQNGKPIVHNQETNPLEGYFYYCVNKTASIMRELSEFLSDDFIFTWVDGIYYNDPTDANDFHLANILNAQNVPFKIEVCDFLEIEQKRSKTQITFFDKNRKYKVFNIPNLNIPLKKDLLKYYNLI